MLLLLLLLLLLCESLHSPDAVGQDLTATPTRYSHKKTLIFCG
jgi:hypothetical protein